MDTNTKPGLLDRLVVKLLNRPAVRVAVAQIALAAVLDAKRRGGMFAAAFKADGAAAAVPPQRYPHGRWSR